MPTSLADKHYSFDIPSHLLFQSPLSRGTTPDNPERKKELKRLIVSFNPL